MGTLLSHLRQLLGGNPFLVYLRVFPGGILSSSSPCALATIPLPIRNMREDAIVAQLQKMDVK